MLGFKHFKKPRRGPALAITGIVIGALILSYVLVAPIVLVRHARLHSRNEAKKLVGQASPRFTITGASGVPITDLSLKGSVYVLAFSPSIDFLAKLETIYFNYKAEGLKVINIFAAKNEEALVAFTNPHIIPIREFNPGYVDVHILDGEKKAILAFYATHNPETVLVGRDGKIIKVLFGADCDKELEEAIIAALATGN